MDQEMKSAVFLIRDNFETIRKTLNTKFMHPNHPKVFRSFETFKTIQNDRLLTSLALMAEDKNDQARYLLLSVASDTSSAVDYTNKELGT